MKTFLRGALAGLAGAAAMKGALYLWHSGTKNEERHGAFGLDDQADVDSAKMLAQMLGQEEPSREVAKAIGLAMHYGYGAGAGALYALLAEQYPAVRLGRGTAFGGLMWLIGDELAVTLSKLSDPHSKSFASHGAALGTHLLFGLVVETTDEHLSV